MAKQALGRGLGALIPEKEKTVSVGIQRLEINSIDANQQQPRSIFQEESLNELQESIKQTGMVQPIVVRKRGDRYELIAGERRLRAVRILGWTEIDAVIKEASDEKSLEMALVENIQRSNSNAMEEARAYMRLMRDYDMTQERVAEVIGKSRVSVSNTLRLLNLPLEVQDMIEKEEISFGHARTLLGLESASEQIALSKEIVSKGYSVREVEEKVQAKTQPSASKRRAIRKDPLLTSWEDKLQEVFHTKVRIRQGQKKGRIEIEYYSQDELERILLHLSPNRHP